MKCVIDGCDREATSRGLCNTCYQTARRLVAKGKLTWEQLVEWGLALTTEAGGAFATALAAKLLERKKLEAAKAAAEAPSPEPKPEPAKAPGLIGVPTAYGAAEEKARLLAAFDRGVAVG